MDNFDVLFVETKQELLLMMHIGNTKVTVSTVKILSFGADRSIQTVEIKFTLLLKAGLIGVYTFAIPSAHLHRHYKIAEHE